MKKTGRRSFGWFILINSLLATLISARYFFFFPISAFTSMSSVFAFTSALGHMPVLVALFGVIFIPAAFIPDIRLRRFILALGGSVGLSLLFIDTIVFAQYRFHINAVVVGLIMAGDIVSFPLITWAMSIGGFLAVLALEFALITVLETRINRIRAGLGRRVTLAFFLMLLTANLLHIWGVAHANQSVSMVTRYLPLYYPATATTMLKRWGLADLDAVKRLKELRVDDSDDLNYPLNPLRGKAPETLHDIMLIVIDSWRYDTFSPEFSPNIYSLAEKGIVYNNHISTGNSTRTGIFGLFYGIPGTYWHAFLAGQRSAVLIDRMQELNYQLGIFTSAQLIKPEFNRTVFRNLPVLRLRSEGDSASEKDISLTDDWLKWYAETDSSKPVFSFLFYDSPHAYDFPEDYEPKFKPMVEELNYLLLNKNTDPAPLFNRYRTSVHFADSLVAKVIGELKTKGKLDNTLIIITGDHGQEMNDNKLNYWGHNSNFTDAQVKVPFIVVGPGVEEGATPEYLDSFTSHEDLSPTLMKNYLGVENDTSDYSTGADLFGIFTDRDWVISSQYSGYGIITHDSILDVNAAGNYEILDKSNRPIKRSLNVQNTKEALERISRYLK